MDNLELRPLLSREEILMMWSPMINSKIPEIYGMDNLCESVGMVLLGQASALIGILNGERVGCMIYQSNGDTALIRQLYGPGLGFKFRDLIVAKFKELGFKRISGTSSHINGDAFQRLFNMKKIYTYYEREV
ncbi:MAG: hypothetical protein WC444_06500 [Candidatus Paceibacterota bacterium]